MIQQTSVIRPAKSGVTSLNNLFKGMKIKADPFFEEFLWKNGENFHDDAREYFLFKTDSSSNSDSIIMKEFEIVEFSTPAELRATLEWLDGEGRYLLDIPEGQEETNFIIGYAIADNNRNNVQYVFYVEHEFEHGAREIHLHVKTLDKWHDDNPSGLAKKSKLN